MKLILIFALLCGGHIMSQSSVVKALIIGEFDKQTRYIIAYKNERNFLTIPKGYYGVVLNLDVDDSINIYDPFPLNIYRQTFFGRIKNEGPNILFEPDRGYLILENDRTINGRKYFSHYWHHKINSEFSIPELAPFYKLLE